MPRYHFHLVSDYARVPDCDGVDLSDAWAARREAFLVADELVKPGTPEQHRKWKGWSVQVVDHSGDEILFVSVAGVATSAGREAEREGEKAPFAADRAEQRDAGTAARRRDVRSEVFDRTERLAAEAKVHLERCKQLQQAVARQIDMARQTARLSAQLIEQARALPAGPPS